MLIDYGSTHNFIDFKLVKLLSCFIYPTLEYQVMIVDGSTIKFSRNFHNINLIRGEYLLDSPIIKIQMGSVDVVSRI
jgi:hypothetical protein